MPNAENIFIVWVKWQFIEMPNFLFAVWKNYFLFAVNYFSAPVLLKTFFAPWKKYNWQYSKNFDIKQFFQTLISNIFSRLIGVLLRTALLIIGILFQLLVIVTGFVILVAWIFMPFMAIMSIIIFFYV